MKRRQWLLFIFHCSFVVPKACQGAYERHQSRHQSPRDLLAHPSTHLGDSIVGTAGIQKAVG